MDAETVVEAARVVVDEIVVDAETVEDEDAVVEVEEVCKRSH